jgi:hypothetical protein
MNELFAVLLSWASTLSGYPMPDAPAEVVPVSHQTLVERACGGRECKVLGWFPPGRRIYVDERLTPRDNLLAASIVVHEMVHYLQYKAAAFDGLDCAKSLELEREAYAVQREFLLRYGVYQPVGVNSHRACTLAHDSELEMEARDKDVKTVARPVTAVAVDEGEEQTTTRDYIDAHRQTTSWLMQPASRAALKAAPEHRRYSFGLEEPGK